ncbi:MAG: 5-deoxy-glucuronate isomerase [Verrucomicrobia bacterium]|nr:MAG: 5-deoxy-glucuronate isomerase [Verrucomicrobiota bacterium]
MSNMQTPSLDGFRRSSRSLRPQESGELLRFTRQDVGWKWMSFLVRRLVPGQVWETRNAEEETVVLMLGGTFLADWGEGRQQIGQRKNVFDGLPYAVYLPAGFRLNLEALTECEFVACSVPSSARLEPRLITPADVTASLRGGGNASRQIVDVVRPDFPADKLMIIEVYTPSGNWSSYPPHKHDVHNPPHEVDLDEIYYYRMAHPSGYAYHRLYTADGKRDVTLTVTNGDAVLVRDGYHPVVAGHGYHVYYLNCLAGSARSLANTEDPQHTWVRSTWETVDSRLPLIPASRD